MAEYTAEQIEACYNVAKEFYEGRITSIHAATEKLLKEHGIKDKYREKKIYGFRRLMNGTGSSTGLTENFLSYYFKRIEREYGRERAIICLQGLERFLLERHNADTEDKRKIHYLLSEKFGTEQIFESEPPYNKINNSVKLEIGKLLKDSWKITNTNDYKIHFAVKNKNEVEPFDVCSADPYEWRKWQEYKPQYNMFNRKYIFSMLNYYNEPETWLFGGVWEVLSEKDNKYVVKLTNQLEEYIGRLKIGSSYSKRAKRVNMENHYDEFIVKEILEDPYFIVAIEDSSLTESEDDMEKPTDSEYTIESIVDCFIEKEELERFLYNLEEKKNLILQGPPGTGKTWLAKKLGYALIGKNDRRQIMSVQFHPNMSYEDFIMGYRPSGDGRLEKDFGIFMKFVEKAHGNPDEKFVMVIEEINRGNPAQIFGEMLTLLEADKRDKSEALQLCYQNDFELPVYIPKNFFVIGTMNLADRSLAVVDFAFRRRFAFIDLEPQFNDVWLEYIQKHFPDDKQYFANTIRKKIENLNDKIKNDASLGKQFCIGHSYFTPKRKNGTIEKIDNPESWFKNIYDTEIKPLLEEYWFDGTENLDDESEEA